MSSNNFIFWLCLFSVLVSCIFD